MSFAAEVINGALSDILCPLDNRNLNTKAVPTAAHRTAPTTMTKALPQIDASRSKSQNDEQGVSRRDETWIIAGSLRLCWPVVIWEAPLSAIFPMTASKGRVRHENIMRDVKATRRTEIIQMSFA